MELLAMDPLLAWRAEFPILGHTTYMISHSLGAMPARAAKRMQEFTDTWAARGIRAWEEGWWEMPVTVGNLVGAIIGAGEGETVMQQNVSICQSVVTSCFDWSGRRNKLVTDGLNFPSNDYIYHGLARQGARVVTAVSEDGFTLPVERVLAAIDEETQLVSVSHVAFRSSYIQDLGPIVERAHRVGAMVIADLYQSAGTVPVDVRALGLDFATGGSVKWLCGGPGAGYLYVRRDLWETLRPAATGWMAHEQPFAFEAGPIRYAGDAFRFLNGTPNVPALYSARSGYEIIQEIGVAAIREKSRRQTARLMALAEEAGIRVNVCREPEKRGGTVTLDVRNGQEVTRELARRDILVDYRPGAGVRVAPHFYTSDDELEHTVREIQDILYRSRFSGGTVLPEKVT
jgi:kynureninase